MQANRIILKTALQLFVRDLRGGGLTLMMLSLILAVGALTSIHLLSDRLTRTLEFRSSEYLGADLAVASAVPIPEAWMEEARKRGLQSLSTIEFSTVLLHQDEILMVSTKAVPAAFPLRGQYRVEFTGGVVEEPEHAVPSQGSVWVEAGVLEHLKLKIGEVVNLGETQLSIAGIIRYEPDKRGDLFSLAPRVLMNVADLEAAKVLLPGSRARYYALVSGDERQMLAFSHWLQPQLQLGQKLNDLKTQRPELGTAIERARTYLGMTALLVALLSGVALGLSAHRLGTRHTFWVALLKCLGLSPAEVLTVLLLELLGLGVLASLLGTGLGVLLEERLLALVEALLPQALVALRWETLAYGPIVGLLCLAIFAAPPLLEAASIPPMHVLRATKPKLRLKGLTYLPGTVLTLGLIVKMGSSPLLMVKLMGGFGVFLLILMGALTLMVRLLGKWSPERLNLRLAVRQLTRRPGITARQILWLMLVLSVWSILSTARFELLEEWRSKLDAEAPNYFVMNLMTSEREAFLELLDHKGIPHSQLYPITRGRLVTVNGASITERVLQDPKLEGALNRELSLTTASKLPEGNAMVSGDWEDPKGISMEQKLAQQLGVKMGDRLGFLIQGKMMEVSVTSIRSVVWDTLTPNFYVIFRDAALTPYPTTWLGSFHISADQRSVLPELIRVFPSASLIDVDKIVGHFRMIIQEVTLAFEVLWSLAMVAAALTLILTIAASMEERLREYAIQRILGATSFWIRSTQALEFMILGLLASGGSIILSEIALNGLSYFVLETTPHVHFKTAWALTLLGGLVMTTIALIISPLLERQQRRMERNYQS